MKLFAALLGLNPQAVPVRELAPIVAPAELPQPTAQQYVEAPRVDPLGAALKHCIALERAGFSDRYALASAISVFVEESIGQAPGGSRTALRKVRAFVGRHVAREL